MHAFFAMKTAAALLAAMLLACSHDVVRSQAPTTVIGVSPSRVLGPYVPAGERLSASLDPTLSTTVSVPGQPFTATLETALQGSDGRILVPTGARILGHVVSTQGPDFPQLVLSFDTVQTPLGAAPIAARVVDVGESQADRESSRVERELLSSPPTPLPPSGVPITAPPPAIGGPIVLSSGAVLRLELTRPIFPPGTLVGQ
jgi:hypothetical protein